MRSARWFVGMFLFFACASVASTTQFTDIEAAFADMGKVTGGTVSRGLVVTGRDTQVAEATFSYTIVR